MIALDEHLQPPASWCCAAAGSGAGWQAELAREFLPDTTVLRLRTACQACPALDKPAGQSRSTHGCAGALIACCPSAIL